MPVLARTTKRRRMLMAVELAAAAGLELEVLPRAYGA
jgi:hypothetical protein